MSSVNVHHLILSEEEVEKVEKALVTVEAIEHVLQAFGIELPPYEERPSRVLEAIRMRTRYGHAPVTLAAGESS